jgi:catechol O-methyltransferase
VIKINFGKFDDGREIALLHFIYKHPNLAELRGNPQKILEAIDEYGRTKKYLMNIGPYKSGTVIDLILKEKPSIVVELGGYVGYSAIAFGNALRKAGGKRYYSLEFNPEFGAVIGSLIELAGLSDLVKVVIGASSDSLRRLHAEGKLKHIDLLFLDHYKPLYVKDLKICEELGLVGQGSILAADNGLFSVNVSLNTN